MPPLISKPDVDPSSKKVTKSLKATCFIVPLSFITIRSAVAKVVEDADVSPSMIFNSAVVTVAPSKIPTSVEVKEAKAEAAPD